MKLCRMSWIILTIISKILSTHIKTSSFSSDGLNRVNTIYNLTIYKTSSGSLKMYFKMHNLGLHNLGVALKLCENFVNYALRNTVSNCDVILYCFVLIYGNYHTFKTVSLENLRDLMFLKYMILADTPGFARLIELTKSLVSTITYSFHDPF